MFISLVVLGLIVLGVLICSKDKDPVFTELDPKEHPLRILYPLSSKLFAFVKKTGKQGVFGAEDVLREIYVDEKPEISLKKQGCKCIASALAVIAATAFICFAYTYSKESLLIDAKYLRRNQAGAGSKKYDLMIKAEVTEKLRYTIDVSEQKLQGEDFERLKTEAAYYLDKRVLCGNKSADCVRDKIKLPGEIPGTGVTVKWGDDNSWFVAVDGTLKNEEYSDPVPVTLHAELTYYENVWDYYYDLIIYPPIITEKDIFLNDLKEKLSDIDSETQTEELYELPLSVDEIDIGWEEEEDNTVRNFFIMGLLAAGIILPALKKDLKDKQKKRTEQMMRDYPDIISKFIMLITAGMTCRAAWEKICSDYRRSIEREKSKDEAVKTGKKKKAGNRRYAYEEMIISNNEMQLGLPEIKVYERFGTRCSVPAYNRFGNMLARNIKRGSAGIIEILESEAKESFAERRENVRKKGEETGTRLLIPMFGMLILVIAIVVVPAFSSFSF